MLLGRSLISSRNTPGLRKEFSGIPAFLLRATHDCPLSVISSDLPGRKDLIIIKPFQKFPSNSAYVEATNFQSLSGNNLREDFGA